MPGISVKFDSNKKKITDGNDVEELFSDALNSLIHNDYYKQEILLTDDNYLIGCTKYAEYPINIFENSEFWVCVEGKIYGKTLSALNDEIYALLRRIFEATTPSEEDKKVIADWLLETDGDFVIYALNKNTKDFVIMNDVLGRLPFYYYYKDKVEIIASREIQFISYLINDNRDNDNKFDKMGIAQFLLFSHTLGKRTLLSNVYRLEPASLLRINNNNSKFQIDTIYRFNFEIKKYSNDSNENNARELVSLFSEACKNRVDDNSKNIISLSGGFDSRAVAASFHKNKIPGYAVTSTEPHWRPVEGSTSETEIAEQIAKSLNIDWENYGIMKPQAEDLIMMLKMKKGLTYLAHSFLLPFLEKVKHKHGSSPINFFTGHGGDILFANLSFEISNLDHLIRGIIHVKGFFSLQEVASLIQIKESEIVDEIRNILSSYPEENFSQKLVHYLFFESNAKLSFEIEDINRFYFWSVAPFYSIPFFEYIMNCPDKHKSKHDLYREFLLKISPSVAEIKNSNWGCSILSRKFRILQSIMTLYWKYSDLRKIIKKLKDKRGYSYKHDSKIIRCIQDQLNNCDVISNHLSRKGIEKIMNNCTDYSHYGIDNLFTITSLIEKTLCKNTMIEKYYNE